MTIGTRRATLRASTNPSLLAPDTVTETEMDFPPAADTWEGILAALRRRYPGQKDSVLFCIYKLQHNPDLTLRDFREEAALHRIPMAGRSLHSARVLLGLTKAERAPESPPEAPAVEPLPRLVRANKRGSDAKSTDGGSIEDKVVAAVRQIQSAAGAQSEQLRAAIQQAIAILQRALDS